MPESAIANRRAALLAHAMPAQDRDWLLAELDVRHRHVLAGLLEELRSMGVPRDAALVRQLLDEEAAGDPEKSLIDLPSTAVPRLVDVLRAEPRILVVTFLHVRPWTWRDMALRGLDESTRQAFEGGAPPTAPRLRHALVGAVWRSMERSDGARPMPRQRADRWIHMLRGAASR